MRLETLLSPETLLPLGKAGPGPIAHPAIPVHLAAVNRVMCRVAREAADGIRPHPVCTASYIEHVMLPAVRDGTMKAGRPLSGFRVCMKPLIATARTEAGLQPKIRDARARIAFCASTPTCFAAFDHLGLGGLANECKLRSRAKRWEALPERKPFYLASPGVPAGTA